MAQSQYDPLGLLSVYMVKWKLLMRKVTLKGKEGNWETPLDKEEEEEFRQLLRDLKELKRSDSQDACNLWKGSSEGQCYWSSEMDQGKPAVH